MKIKLTDNYDDDNDNLKKRKYCVKLNLWLPRHAKEKFLWLSCQVSDIFRSNFCFIQMKTY